MTTPEDAPIQRWRSLRGFGLSLWQLRAPARAIDAREVREGSAGQFLRQICGGCFHLSRLKLQTLTQLSLPAGEAELSFWVLRVRTSGSAGRLWNLCERWQRLAATVLCGAHHCAINELRHLKLELSGRAPNPSTATRPVRHSALARMRSSASHQLLLD